MYVGAVVMLGILTFVAMNGPSYIVGVIRPFGFGLGFYWTSICLLSVLYAAVIYPLYKPKAVWVMGLGFGAMEGIGTLEAIAFNRNAINLGYYAWDAYIGFITLLFVLSLFALRKQLRRHDAAEAFLAAAALMTLAGLPGISEVLKTGVGQLGFLWSVAYDSLIMCAVLLITASARIQHGGGKQGS